MHRDERWLMPREFWIDYRITRHTNGENDLSEEEEELNSMEVVRRRLLDARPPFVPFDLDEIMRNRPKRRYTRRSTKAPTSPHGE